jgi:hypothetical protein
VAFLLTETGTPRAMNMVSLATAGPVSVANMEGPAISKGVDTGVAGPEANCTAAQQAAKVILTVFGVVLPVEEAAAAWAAHANSVA